jgi:hypothetical protein
MLADLKDFKRRLLAKKGALQAMVIDYNRQAHNATTVEEMKKYFDMESMARVAYNETETTLAEITSILDRNRVEV